MAVEHHVIAFSDARPCMQRKLSAVVAHRSQFGITDEMLRDPPRQVADMLAGFRPVFETETFVMGGVRGPVSKWPLADLFDGICCT